MGIKPFYLTVEAPPAGGWGSAWGPVSISDNSVVLGQVVDPYGLVDGAVIWDWEANASMLPYDATLGGCWASANNTHGQIVGAYYGYQIPSKAFIYKIGSDKPELISLNVAGNTYATAINNKGR